MAQRRITAALAMALLSKNRAEPSSLQLAARFIVTLTRWLARFIVTKWLADDMLDAQMRCSPTPARPIARRAASSELEPLQGERVSSFFIWYQKPSQPIQRGSRARHSPRPRVRARQGRRANHCKRRANHANRQTRREAPVSIRSHSLSAALVGPNFYMPRRPRGGLAGGCRRRAWQLGPRTARSALACLAGESTSTSTSPRSAALPAAWHHC